MALKNHKLSSNPEDPLNDILNRVEALSEESMLRVRNMIDQHLKTNIADLNLAEELALQYRQGKRLLTDAQSSKDSPLNQQAQVFNTVQAQLEKIIKLQQAVYSQERLKRYEVAFMKCSELLPLDARKRFFDLYQDYLNEVDKLKLQTPDE